MTVGARWLAVKCVVGKHTVSCAVWLKPYCKNIARWLAVKCVVGKHTVSCAVLKPYYKNIARWLAVKRVVGKHTVPDLDCLAIDPHSWGAFGASRASSTTRFFCRVTRGERVVDFNHGRVCACVGGKPVPVVVLEKHTANTGGQVHV